MSRLIDADETRRQIIAFATGLNQTWLSVDTVMMLLAQVPADDVATVRHGRWVPTKAPFMNECEDCSVCGYRTVWGHRYNYCPNCGAKMDKEE